MKDYLKKNIDYLKNNKKKIIVCLVVVACLIALTSIAQTFKKTIIIHTPGQEIRVSKIGNITTLQALKKADITLNYNDYVSTPLSKSLEDNEEIVVTRAREIFIHEDGEIITVSTGLQSEEDIAAQVGIDLDDIKNLTKVSNTSQEFYFDVTLSDNQKLIYTESPIEYETVYEVSDELEGFDTKLKQEGENGSRGKILKVSYDKNGNEISSTTLFEEDVIEPKDEIILVSKDRDSIVETTSGDIQRYTKKYTVTATGYCPCIICCGKTNGITASGAKASEGTTIAAWSSLPFGTEVYIPYFDNGSDNKGIYEVQDRGGAITNEKIDIFFNSHEEALKFGRRTIEIYIIE